MWRSLEGFYDKSSHQREVVSSVLHGQANAHSIDANDIVFQVHLYVHVHASGKSPERNLRAVLWLNIKGETTSNVNQHFKSGTALLYRSLVTSLMYVTKLDVNTHLS